MYKQRKPRQALASAHRIYPTLSDWQAWTNSADPDQTPQNAASDLGLHRLPLFQQFSDISIDSKIYLFKFLDKYGKDFMRTNT